MSFRHMAFRAFRNLRRWVAALEDFKDITRWMLEIRATSCCPHAHQLRDSLFLTSESCVCVWSVWA